MTTTPNPGVERTRCIQCGRHGTRGFKHYPATVVDWLPCKPFTIPAFSECAAKKACRSRRPTQRTWEDA